AGDLVAVADGEHRPALLGELLDGAHDRRVRGHGAGAQVVAVGEAAREHDRLGVAERRLLVPREAHRLPHHAPDDVEGVVVAVAAGESDDGYVHFTISKRYSSITVLARSFSHICFKCPSTSLTSSASCISMNLPMRASLTSPKPSRPSARATA